MHVTSGAPGYALNSGITWNVIPAAFPVGGTLSTNETPDFYVVLQDL